MPLRHVSVPFVTREVAVRVGAAVNVWNTGTAAVADEDEVEGRAVLAFSLAIGYHFIAADHGALSRPDVVKLSIARLARP